MQSDAEPQPARPQSRPCQHPADRKERGELCDEKIRICEALQNGPQDGKTAEDPSLIFRQRPTIGCPQEVNRSEEKGAPKHRSPAPQGGQQDAQHSPSKEQFLQNTGPQCRRNGRPDGPPIGTGSQAVGPGGNEGPAHRQQQSCGQHQTQHPLPEPTAVGTPFGQKTPVNPCNLDERPQQKHRKDLGTAGEVAAVGCLHDLRCQPAPGAFSRHPAQECRPRAGLTNFFAKANTPGADIKIAYFGGSITAQTGYRVKTLAWFKEAYPQAKFSEINAAIGGTGSDLGVFRLKQDVLDQKPDLMFVEFAVNDGGAAPELIQRCMEGIVRQTWRALPDCDICFVYTLTEALAPAMLEGKFQRSASAMEKIADHYGIPTIHMAMEVAKLRRRAN
jgi:hypothetical protein